MRRGERCRGVDSREAARGRSPVMKWMEITQTESWLTSLQKASLGAIPFTDKHRSVRVMAAWGADKSHNRQHAQGLYQLITMVILHACISPGTACHPRRTKGEQGRSREQWIPVFVLHRTMHYDTYLLRLSRKPCQWDITKTTGHPD